MNDNYNYNYSNYDEYHHERRMKNPSTAVYIGFKWTDLTQFISDERIVERAERIEKVRSICYERKKGRIKLSPYKQVTYTNKTNVRTVSTHTNAVAMQRKGNKGVTKWNVVARVSTMNFLCTTTNCYKKRGVRSNDTAAQNSIPCLLYTSRCV